jgi:hypothetical protein
MFRPFTSIDRGRHTGEGHILFSHANDLYIADNDGSNPRKLLSAAGPIGEPNISPDNKRLVFTVYLRSANSIVVSNADGSDQRTVVDSSEGRRVCCAQWTPDGRYITFEDRNGGRTPRRAADDHATPVTISSQKGALMRWNHYVAYFFGGAFLANAIPHLVNGISGNAFQSPFASPPGVGLSSSTVNALWGLFNLAIAYLLICRVGSFQLRRTQHVLVLGAGILIMAIMLARAFGRLHGGL